MKRAAYRLRVVRPPGRRHLERRDAALRFRRRNHRRAAPGRLGRCALQPTPQQRGGANQRDYSCENTGQANSPVDRAHTSRGDRLRSSRRRKFGLAFSAMADARDQSDRDFPAIVREPGKL
jgi:hypothetical protein